MTHPSRVLNLDMKAKALYAKQLYLTTYIYFFFLRVHLRLNRTAMRRDNTLPMPVSPRLTLTSRIFPQFVFPGFSLPLINQRSKFEFQMLKTFLFHILHVTQSRISMGLTVSRKSVENPAIRRKNRQIGTLFFPPTMDY